MKQLLKVLLLTMCVGFYACGGSVGGEDFNGATQDSSVQDLSSDQGGGPVDEGSLPGFPESPNEIEFLLQNHTEEVITIKMHGETITPGWFEVLADDQSQNIYEQCSLCFCDVEPSSTGCDECPDLEPNYSELNPGGLVSRYWSGNVFPVESSAEGQCEREEIVSQNDLVARLCWWPGPKEIAPDAEQTCVDLPFKAWEEIQVIHQVK